MISTRLAMVSIGERWDRFSVRPLAMPKRIRMRRCRLQTLMRHALHPQAARQL